MSGLFAELKRRNVLRAGALYAAAAWLLVQVATQVFPFFDIPDWAVRWTVIAAVAGFPIVLTISWFYELTPQGFKSESDLALSESVPRHGHRMNRWIIAILGFAIVLLVADRVVLRKDTIEVHTATPDAASPTAAKAIAVMPLTDEGGEQSQQYFSDGLSEDLITTLSQFDSLKVISRNSSFRFRDGKDDAKAIGQKLGVTHLLEGSVRHAGDAVRISASLVNVADGSTLWSQRYDREYKDLFALQDEISNAVATALAAKLVNDAGVVMQNDRPPSGNLDAYQSMLQGRFYRFRGNQEDQHKAISLYNEAIRLDPGYARAYTGLAIAWANLGGNFLAGDEAQQAYAKARAAAATALSLNPNLAAAHVAHGKLLEILDFDRAGAEAEYRLALRLAPNDGDAKYYLALMAGSRGQPEQAIEQIRQALDVDPLRAGSYDQICGYLAVLGRLDEAERACRTAIEMQPATASFHARRALIEVLQGNAQAAVDAAEQAPAGSWKDIALATAHQIGDDRAAADAALQNLIDKQAGNSAYQIAEVYALRKQSDLAFEWLERARANRDPGIATLLTDPLLLAYKDDPRFTAFCGKVRLPVPGEVASR
jgi:TolB-like protein/Tfp pilus assembly protein PilF